MSTTTTNLPRTGFELAVLTGTLDEKLYLSLFGPTVWAMQRRGVQPSLLLDLYHQRHDLHTQTAGIGETFAAAAASTTHGGLTGLAAVVEARTGDLRRKHRVRWAAERPYELMYLSHAFGVKMGDARLLPLKKMSAVLFGSVFSGVLASYKYRSQIKTIWYDICDTAAGIDGATSEVTA